MGGLPAAGSRGPAGASAGGAPGGHGGDTEGTAPLGGKAGECAPGAWPFPGACVLVSGPEAGRAWRRLGRLRGRRRGETRLARSRGPGGAQGTPAPGNDLPREVRGPRAPGSSEGSPALTRPRCGPRGAERSGAGGGGGLAPPVTPARPHAAPPPRGAPSARDGIPARTWAGTAASLLSRLRLSPAAHGDRRRVGSARAPPASGARGGFAGTTCPVVRSRGFSCRYRLGVAATSLRHWCVKSSDTAAPSHGCRITFYAFKSLFARGAYGFTSSPKGSRPTELGGL